jgi:tryptophan-rich sensory protein
VTTDSNDERLICAPTNIGFDRRRRLGARARLSRRRHRPIDTGSPLGQAVFTIIAAIAQLERSLLVERVKTGLRRARDQGKHIGRPPLQLNPITLQSVRSRRLDKPAWNPPSWLFAPVWIVLYILMGIAGWVVWRRGGGAVTLILWGLHLALNAGRSPLFFGLHRPDLAVVDIALLWLVLAATVIAFWRVSSLSGALLVPYLCG